MDADDWRLEEKVEQVGEVTLDRLHLLVQKGYQPDFSRDPLGAIWLYHPRTGFGPKQLILYGSGLITSPSSVSDEYRIEREEKEAFNRFLKTVPVPSFWERTRRGRTNVYAWLIICAVMFGPVVLLELVRAFWR
jgi:hypothetical protein